MSQQLSVYVHIPFCRWCCPYCAFYSLDTAGDQEIAAYPRLLLRELDLKAQDWRGLSLKSIYFGGGTPSLLSPETVGSIIEAIEDIYPAETDREITLEANPGTVNQYTIEEFHQAGVNRFSIGVQAFDEDRLNFLGRIHDLQEIDAALKAVKSLPDVTLSIDLMSGIPSETTETWDRELDQLFAHDPDGISFYSLTVEEGTKLAERMIRGEAVHLPADETVSLLLHAAQRMSQQGYLHYEVSNWAKPGKECRQNQHYWQRGLYLGLGPSAHSFDGKQRVWNRPDLTSYRQALEKGDAPPYQSELLTDENHRSEWVYLKLRQSDGLDYSDYQDLFGAPPHYWTVMFKKIAETGLGEFDGRRFKPNDRGLLLADEISARILG
ncbi:radical SAM family heme chaperone HemW [bacterium]|nr:radical SAM family heme chaperone HemW [bacterium]